MRLLRRRGASGQDREPPTWSDRQSAAAALEAHAVRAGPVIDLHPALSILGTRPQALGYLHARWVRLLGAAIDAELEADPGAVVEASWSAWRRVGAAHPGLAAVLSHYADDPAVRAADERHRALLSSAAGCPPGRLPCFEPCHPLPDQEELDDGRLLTVHG